MPPAPELGNRLRPVRRIKIHRDIDIKKLSDTRRHIAIPRKVKIYLECIAKHYNQRIRRSQGVHVRIARVDGFGKGIRQQHFF